MLVRIASMDIGTKNTAVYIEEFETNDFKVKDFKKVGKRVWWKLVNFESPHPSSANASCLFTSITKFLDENKSQWDKCNGFIIEKQLSINYNATVVQHFIMSYFRYVYGSFKYTSEISATRKTQVLGAPKKMDKPTRKKWAVEETNRILTLRKDLEGIAILNSSKKDDLSDCFLQLKAFQKLVFVDKILP